MTVRAFIFLVPCLIVLGTSREAEAQGGHAASQSVLDAAVEQHVDTIAADRDAILRVLSRSEVQAVASRAGISLRNHETAVSRLQGDELAHAATLARHAEESLAGGASTMLGAWTLYILGLAIVPLVLLVVVLL